jgi:hypothetical protein
MLVKKPTSCCLAPRNAFLQKRSFELPSINVIPCLKMGLGLLLARKFLLSTLRHLMKLPSLLGRPLLKMVNLIIAITKAKRNTGVLSVAGIALTWVRVIK